MWNGIMDHKICMCGLHERSNRKGVNTFYGMKTSRTARKIWHFAFGVAILSYCKILSKCPIELAIYGYKVLASKV